MPIYEYSCAKCQKVIETVQKFSDPPLAACPDCGSKVEKLISKTSFQLKGTGWYATDYKKSGAATASSKSPPPARHPDPRKKGGRQREGVGDLAPLP